MARKANRRWTNLTLGRRLPKQGAANRKAKQRDQRILDKLNGPVTVRKATPADLASLSPP